MKQFAIKVTVHILFIILFFHRRLSATPETIMVQQHYLHPVVGDHQHTPLPYAVQTD